VVAKRGAGEGACFLVSTGGAIVRPEVAAQFGPPAELRCLASSFVAWITARGGGGRVAFVVFFESGPSRPAREYKDINFAVP